MTAVRAARLTSSRSRSSGLSAMTRPSLTASSRCCSKRVSEAGRGGVQGVCGLRLGADLGRDELVGFSLAGDDYLALVREVVEEGAPVQSGPLGDLRDRRLLAVRGRGASDGVIHLAFGSLAGGMDESLETDRRAIDAIGAALEGSRKPLVGTTASLTLSFIGGITDRPATEEDVLPGGPRADSENAVIALAGHGVRSSVVRLPPLVHSELDRGGLLPGLIGIARAQGAEPGHRAKFAALAGTAWPCRSRRQACQVSWAKVARMSRTRVSGCSRAKKCPPAAGSLKKTTLA